MSLQTYKTSAPSHSCDGYRRWTVYVGYQLVDSIIAHQFVSVELGEVRGVIPDALGWLDEYILGARVRPWRSPPRHPYVLGGYALPRQQRRGRLSLPHYPTACLGATSEAQRTPRRERLKSCSASAGRALVRRREQTAWCAHRFQEPRILGWAA